MSAINAAVSALDAFGVDMNVTANNIANVSTRNFQPSRVDMADRPYDSGVQVAAILRDSPPAPLSPAQVGSAPEDAAPVRPRGTAGLADVSATDLAREFSNMITIDYAYGANASALALQDRTTGYLLDLFA